MSTWAEFETEEPEFAAAVKKRFESGIHMTLATLRRDGSPRISGTECEFEDGEIVMGMMPRSVKANDLFRDPRMALHGPTADPPIGRPAGWTGEAKVAGRAIPIDKASDDPALAGAHYFKVDIEEVVLTALDPAGEMLVIEHWHPGRGRGRIERK